MAEVAAAVPSRPWTTTPRTKDDDTTMTPDDTTMAGPMIAGETVPSGTVVELPAGTDAPNVTFGPADMDETVTVAGIGTFTCVSADGCTVTVADDVVTTSGDIEVVSLEITDAAVLAQLAAAITPPVVPEPTELEQAQAGCSGGGGHREDGVRRRGDCGQGSHGSGGESRNRPDRCDIGCAREGSRGLTPTRRWQHTHMPRRPPKMLRRRKM